MQEKNLKNLLYILSIVLIAISLVLGVTIFDNRKYYFISLLIILLVIAIFLLSFENRKPDSRELVLISVLSSIAVAGRGAFFMFPQFKPMAAVVIVSGSSLGSEAGFLVGALASFISNFLFGQGPWTPWQMIGFGIIGYLSGFLFKENKIKKTKINLMIYGFLSTFIIYGLIMNISSSIIFTGDMDIKGVIASITTGIPFDLIHAFSTLIFLYFMGMPMIKKLDRIRIKYGLIDRKI